MKRGKINVAEILKDYPQGMELDCVMYDNLYFNRVNNIGNIECYIKSKDGYLTRVTFYENGCYNNHVGAKCVIFPKGKTTWKGFQRPFKDGDIISNGNYIAIFYKIGTPYHCTSPNVVYYHCYYSPKFRCFKKEVDFGIGLSTEFKYATEEEKQKLFQAIKDNGYKWNSETKTLEKLIEPKFDEYELVPNKFDINTLVPFESRVLVRSSYGDIWRPAIYGVFDSKKHYHYVVGGNYWIQCIPYEGNEHLLGTTNDCDEYYKTW